RAILVGLVEISSVPLRPGPGGRAKVRKPKVGRLARLDAEKGSGWTTGPAHNVVRLDVVSLNLLPLMDGTRDREALKGALLTAVRDGRIRLKDNKTGLDLAGPALEEAADEHVAAAIERLAGAGLLE